MKVLIANRGEIAVRIMRACREMRLATVAVYSDCDRAAPHVRYADEAVGLGGDAATDSYLRIDKLIDAARCAGADTVHPGYGFLAENADFARQCREAGLRFVGPSAEVIALMGGKTAARQTAERAGIPVVPGTDGPLAHDLSEADLQQAADAFGLPLFVKAVAGGGGKGMRLVRDIAALPSAVRSARSEAGSAFGDPAVYLERCIDRARHVEIQVLGDEHGRVVAFVERECSIQRRHQKVIEETPSTAVTTEVRQALAAAAAALAREVGYVSAGTIEFLLDPSGHFYFLEMNTRLQVEHPITEMVTGVDLVRWQLRIARGERLDPHELDDLSLLEPNGHAIECRVYAEDSDAGFMPCPGRISRLRVPAGPGIRNDAGVDVGYEVPVYYDSMIAKLIAWGADRPQAIGRMTRALDEYDVGGVKTTLPLFRWIMQHRDFAEGRLDTTFLDRALAAGDRAPRVGLRPEVEEIAVVAAAIRTFLNAGAETTIGSAGDLPRETWRRAARLDGLQ